MLYLKTLFDVADNTGARKASMIGVLNAKGRLWAQIGDVIKVNIKKINVVKDLIKVIDLLCY